MVRLKYGGMDLTGRKGWWIENHEAFAEQRDACNEQQIPSDKPFDAAMNDIMGDQPKVIGVKGEASGEQDEQLTSVASPTEPATGGHEE